MAKATKTKVSFFCQECGTESLKWVGKCPGCGQWNTMVEGLKTAPAPARGYVTDNEAPKRPISIKQVDTTKEPRIETSYQELNRVLGGGIVHGSLTLISGEPGIGKSTLLLQLAHDLAQNCGKKVLYVSGEESISQIKLRGERLNALHDDVYLYAETDMALIVQQVQTLAPDFMILDSIQTVYMPEVTSAPGSVTQVRECTAELMKIAKKLKVACCAVGHVTKDGNIAGPRMLEHMVDTVIYFEGEEHGTFRLLRSIKNRYGNTSELGVFDMREHGLVEVSNPSELFLEDRTDGIPGTVIMATMEGTRPLFVEVQSLLAPTAYGNAKRMASGIDQNRLTLILAVIEKRLGLFVQNQDAYVKVTGGIKVGEPAVDLAVALSIIGSYSDKAMKSGDFAVGEVGLTGEVRRVTRLEERLKEAAKLGFTRAIVPKKSLAGIKRPDGLEIVGVETVAEAQRVAFGSLKG